MIGTIIKHKKFMDIAAFITAGEESTFRVSWINLGFVRSFLLGKSQVIEIDDFNDWEKCLNPSDQNCLRYAKWGKL